MFTSVQALILEPGFCDSGEAWETTAFLVRQEAGGGHGGWGLSREGPRGCCLVTTSLSRRNTTSPRPRHRAASGRFLHIGDEQTQEVGEKPSCGGDGTIPRPHHPCRQGGPHPRHARLQKREQSGVPVAGEGTVLPERQETEVKREGARGCPRKFKCESLRGWSQMRHGGDQVSELGASHPAPAQTQRKVSSVKVLRDTIPHE